MRVSTPYEGQLFSGWDWSRPIAAPLSLHSCEVKSEWTDYNDHLSESSYLLVFGDSSDAFFRYFGVDENYRARGFSIYTVETHIRNLLEASSGDALVCTIRILGVDRKRIHVAHEMYRIRDDKLIATAEQMLLHVNIESGRTAEFPMEIQQRLDAIAESHSSLNRPDWVGRSIAMPMKGT
jgi:acyl-CoA thioester hydrolase